MHSWFCHLTNCILAVPYFLQLKNRNNQGIVINEIIYRALGTQQCSNASCGVVVGQ